MSEINNTENNSLTTLPKETCLNTTDIIEDGLIDNPFPVIRIKPNGILCFYNKAASIIIDKWKTGKDKEIPTRIKLIVDTILEKNQSLTREELCQETTFRLTYQLSKNKENIMVFGTDISELIKRQQFISESEKQYKLLVEETTDLIYKTDLNGRFIYANQAVCDLIHYEYAEILGKPFEMLLDEKWLPKIKTFYKTQLIQNENQESYIEFPIRISTNEKIWIGQKAKIIYEQNKPIGFQVFARNITVRKKNENEIAYSNIKLKTLISNLNYGILVEDSNRKINLTNTKFCNLFNIPLHPDQLIGVDCSNSAEESKHLFENPEIFTERIAEILTRKIPVFGEELKMINGKILERDYIPIFINEEYMGHLWQYKDVTESRNIQYTIQRSEEKYRSVIENLELGLIEVDNDGIITKAYDRFAEMTGFSKEELVGTNPESLLFDLANKEKLKLQSQNRLNGKNGVYELMLKKKNGNPLWILVSGTPLFDESKNIVGSLGIHLDITEQKILEKNLEESKIKAEQSLKIKEQFLANMSHEIRTPMNAIIGLSNLLNKTTLSEKQKEYINAISVSSSNLLTIINDILDLTKVESEKIELERIGFNLKKEIEILITSIEAKIQEKKLTFQSTIDSKISNYLVGDPVRLNQILTNLINNAIKFTESGTVELQCILVQKSALFNQIKFTVKDTGIGISSEKINSIFDSFTQEDSSITRRYGGTGLGLTISQKLANLYGSEIKVISQKNIGTEFYFDIIFPIGEAKDVPARGNIKNNVNLSGFTILLVEDNEINRFLAKTILETLHVQVLTANNGKEAIQILEKQKVDTILMDIQMPVMGGIEAIQIIRNQMKLATPIIALTANALVGDEEKYRKAGADGYLSKPFNEHDLENILVQFLLGSSIKEAQSPPKLNQTSSMYNLNKLKEISRGNNEFVKKMLNLFIENTPKAITDIHESLSTGDFKKIKEVAHSIKPGIDMMGMIEEGKQIRLIEELALHDPQNDLLREAINSISDSLFKKIELLKTEITLIQ